MFKIGNILYKDDLVNHTEVEYINYYKVDKNSSLMGIDFRLPTLYVGWELTKKLGENFDVEVSILNKETEKYKSYWEFSFNEKKVDHISGVELFSINAPYYYFRRNYGYIGIDPIFNNIEHVEEIVPKLINDPDFLYNYKDEMLYALKEGSRRVYGIDLKMYEYFNMDIEHIKAKLIENSAKYVEDKEGSIYQEYYKSFSNFEELKRYLVVLLSKA